MPVGIYSSLSVASAAVCSHLRCAVVVVLLFIVAPTVCAVLCPSVYIQAPQWLRLLSVLTCGDYVVVDLFFIVAPIVCAVLRN